MTEQEIMDDFEEDKYTKAYCKRHNCNQCEGTDFNGEPNGYGCEGLKKRVDAMYTSILNRRMKKLKS